MPSDTQITSVSILLQHHVKTIHRDSTTTMDWTLHLDACSLQHCMFSSFLSFPSHIRCSMCTLHTVIRQLVCQCHVTQVSSLRVTFDVQIHFTVAAMKDLLDRWMDRWFHVAGSHSSQNTTAAACVAIVLF